MCIKYKVSIFNHSKDIKGSQNFKMGHVTQATPLYGQFLPCDAMRKGSLCCGPVSVCPSVCHIRAIYPDG